ncbi:MAG: hypothetical protein M1820_006300 [Bogoriella megaspora]|nr:MAG: hypothetical protein M1820_006300 [Bogoriella megaspora]
MVLLFDFIDRQFIHNNPPAPTASFAGKTAIVTGSSSGLGLEACRLLVHLGASKVILACRNVKKAEAAAEDIQSSTSCSSDTLEVWHLDNSSYSSVQKFAERATTTLSRLDVLIANAGLGTRTFRITEDNEETVTTNVVSLFLLALLLHPKLQETARKYDIYTHITVTASELYEVAKFTELSAPPGELFATLNDEKTANMGDRYNVTKLMEIFVIKQMAVLSPLSSSGVIVNCIAPGLCKSELGREYGDGIAIRALVKIFCRPTEVGARTLVWGACAEPETHGQYVPDCRTRETKGLTMGAQGAELQRRIWEELKQKLEGIKPGVTAFA